ncbi:MAG TPA: hypothetical protein VGJ44_20275 [Kribbellaceae bacterium]|jgi:hypothetical protein
MSTALLVGLAADAAQAGVGKGALTAGAILVLVVGVLYAWWHEGTDSITATIFTVFGVFLAASPAGPMIRTMVGAAGGAILSALQSWF